MTAISISRRFMLVLFVISALIYISGERSVNAGGLWYVSTNGNDGNLCNSPSVPCATINGAIGKASDGDTIYVAKGSYTGVGQEVVLLNKNLILSGGWNNTFTTQSGKSVIDGEKTRRGITVAGSATVSVQQFVIQNGFSDGGGGINSGGNTIFENCTIKDNASSIYGGGIMNGENSMTLVNSIVSGNSSDSGGGIWSIGTLTITSSTISGNTGGEGGGIYNFGNTILNNSTISGNQIYGRGGGIFNLGSTTLNSTTITGNRSTFPDAGHCSGPDCSGGGIYSQGTTTIQNTIISGNIAYNLGPDCAGSINTLGYNLIGNTQDCPLEQASDLLNVNPDLWPWLMGSPGYHPLPPTSPAVNAGNPDGCRDHLGNMLETDQRGVSRVGRCDIGSYEYDPALDPLSYVFFPIIENHSCLKRFDDFSNPSSGWPILGDVYKYENGEYHIRVIGIDQGVVARIGFQSFNYNISVDVRNPAGTWSSYGIAFGIAEDYRKFYTLEINPFGGYGIYVYDPLDDVITLSEGYPSVIHPGSATNQIKVERNGETIKAYANGQLLASVADDTYMETRYLGLVVISRAPIIDVYFDNFTVDLGGCEGLNSPLNTTEGWLISPGQQSFNFHITEKDYTNPH